MIVISIMIPIVMAPFTCFFQIMAAGLRLAAVLTVLALRIVQLALRIADSLLALSVIVADNGPCGNCPAQE